MIVCPPEVDVAEVAAECGARGGPEVRVERARDARELKRLLRELAGESGPAVFAVSTTEGRRMVRTEDIVVCQAEGHRFRLWLRNGQQLLSRTTRQSFAQNVAPMLDSGLFLHTGATALVNIGDIESIQDGRVCLSNGMQLSFPARWQAKAESMRRYKVLGGRHSEA